MSCKARALWSGLLLSALGLLAGCAANLAPVYGPGDHGLATGASHYVVRKGDTLYSISWRHGLDYRTVARWNRIDPPYTIRPGQRLRLDGAATRATPTQASRRPAAKTPVAQKPAPKPAPAPTRKSASSTAPAIDWHWPTNGRVSRKFSTDAQGKQGIELQGSVGQAVTAAANGSVVYAGSGLRGYGNLIIIKHGGNYLTAYGYNREILVREGDAVRAGQRIGTMGFGPGQQAALHFELRRDGKPVDPMRYLPVK